MFRDSVIQHAALSAAGSAISAVMEAGIGKGLYTSVQSPASCQPARIRSVRHQVSLTSMVVGGDTKQGERNTEHKLRALSGEH